MEGRHTGEVRAHHHHAGHPEEQNVVACLHHRGWVELAQILRLLGPAERRERPEAGAEPGVEHVGVLGGALRRRLVGAGHHERAVGQVPDRDAVAPPELARDAPVLNVFQPVEVDLLEALGDDLGAALAHGGHGKLGEGLGLYEPLLGHQGLDHLAAALADAHAHAVRLGLHQQTLALKVGEDSLARRKALHPCVGAALLVERGVLIHDVDQRQLMALANLVVVLVVGGRDLHGTGAKLLIHILVCDNRDAAAKGGQHGHAPNQRGEALVVVRHGHRRIAQNRLRARGRHRDPLCNPLSPPAAAPGIPTRPTVHRPPSTVHHRVTHIPDRDIALLVLHLQVAHGGLEIRRPVYKVGAPVDQAVVVEALKRGVDRRGEAGV